MTGSGLKSIPLSAFPAEAWTSLVGENANSGDGIGAYYQSVPWLYAAVNLIANACGSIPIRWQDAGSEEPIDEPGETWAQSFGDLLNAVTGDLLLYGAAYVFRANNRRGVPTELRRLLPTTITPKFDEMAGLTHFERHLNGKTMRLELKDVVYIWEPNRVSEVGPGTSRARAALAASGALANIDHSTTSLFSAGALRPTIISLEDPMDPAEVEKTASTIKRRLQGVKNAFGFTAISGKVSFQTLGDPPSSLAMPELTDSKRQDVATALGVPQTLLFSNAANYACLPGDQRVYTPYGAIPIADMAEGDVIWQYDPEGGIVENVVTAITPQGKAPVYEVRTPNRLLRASDNHLFLVVKVLKGTGNGGGGTKRQSHYFDWKRADELEPGDILVTMEETPDKGETITQGEPLSVELMELLGLYLGDGDSTQGRTLRFAIPAGQEQDVYAAKAERVFTRAYTGVGPMTAKRGKYIFSVNSADAARLVAKMGVTGNAYTKRVPSWVYTASRELRLAFLRGYLDSDGTVDAVRGQITYASASSDLAADVRYLAITCGIPVSNLMHDVGRTGNFGPIEIHRFTCGYPEYNRQIGSNEEKRAARLLNEGNGSRNGRYQQGKTYNIRSLTLPPGVGLSRVVSVDYVGEQDVYDLSTIGSHTFIAEGIVVHNTASQDVLSFYDMTVIPISMRILSAFNSQVFEALGFTAETAEDELEVYQQMQSDQVGALAQLVDRRIITINEARERVGFAPFEDPELPEEPAAAPVVEADEPDELPEPEDNPADRQQRDELRAWERFVTRRVKEGKALRPFKAEYLPALTVAAIEGQIEGETDVSAVKAVFEEAERWLGYP